MGKRKIKSMKRMVERKNSKIAVEIIEYFKSGESHPNEIFQIYEELSKFSEKEIEEAIKETRIGDAIGMSYITAIEMKKNGRWDTYLEEWEKNKDKTGRERLEKYLHERGLDYMLNVNQVNRRE